MIRVSIKESARFMVDCLQAAGAGRQVAEQQAKLLIQADKTGHPSHGLNRLEMYVNEIKNGSCKPNNKPKILKQSDSTAWIDANNVLGATASHFAMDVAIAMAKKTGVGWVTVKGSNHNGTLGYWSRIPAAQGLIGMSFTNTSPLMAPTRSKQSALGTNPISVSAPGSENELFCLDMATTSVALGKIEMQRRKGQPIPMGWAQDPKGKLTTDATLAFNTGCLSPLGGTENTSGYKGYGLAAVVDLFCGMLSGSKYGYHLRKWGSTESGPIDLGHCFIVVNPRCFAPGFGERLTDSMRHWRKLPPVDPSLPVLAPGDKEKTAAEKSDKDGFISYVKQQIESSEKLAKTLKVNPIKPS